MNDDERASIRGDAFVEQVALVPKLFTLLLWQTEIPAVDDNDRRCNGEINASSVLSWTIAERCWRWNVDAWIMRGALRRRLVGLGIFEERKFKCELPLLPSICIVVCFIIVRDDGWGDAEHDRLVFVGIWDVILLVDIDGGVKGGIMTILLRDCDDGKSSSDVTEVNIRRKKEANLAIFVSHTKQ